MALFGIGYEKFEFPAHKKNQTIRESNCTLKRVLQVFQSSCVLCVLHCGFFRAFVNLLVETAITTKITFDDFVKPKLGQSQRLVCNLTQVEFSFFMSGTFELADMKIINISLRSWFLKFSSRA